MKAPPPRLALVATALSSLLVFAHFLRLMDLPGMLAALAAPGLFALRHPAARRLIQAAAIAAGGLWVSVTLGIGAERMAAGEAWLRMALILGGVGAFSLLPAFLLEGKTSRSWFRPGP